MTLDSTGLCIALVCSKKLAEVQEVYKQTGENTRSVFTESKQFDHTVVALWAVVGRYNGEKLTLVWKFTGRFSSDSSL